MFENVKVASHFNSKERAVVFQGDCMDLLRQIPDESIQLVVTSPPYNIGKEYENRRHLNQYLEQQRMVIRECVRTLRKSGSICWQVGNYVEDSSIIPLGKSPGDVWTIPNVKSNHVEKTQHPCQFPVELIERLVLSMTEEDDWVLDPFLGVGTTIIAAMRHNRRGVGAEILPKYVDIALDRIKMADEGTLRIRPMNRPVFDPQDAGTSLTTAPWLSAAPATSDIQLGLLERQTNY